MKILIIGCNGFIGSNLAEKILQETDWDVYGMDINTHYLSNILGHSRFHFTEGDISISNEWIQYHVKKCDVILPLVAIATPKAYITNPLKVFELDFEQNLKVVRWVAQYEKRLIFPSTSEIYGMATDEKFNEETTNLVYGPINKVRWIYASSKQLLDRIIYALGRDHGLQYTCFRPFNWIGPRLDSMSSARIGNSRVLTQFITDLHDNRPISLVGDGSQKRCFLDIKDGMSCLMKILQNPEKSNKMILNIGNPKNEFTIREIATMTRKIYAQVKKISEHNLPPIQIVTEAQFYGAGFQDIVHRVPDISLAQKTLDWAPSVPIEESILNAVTFFDEITCGK